MKKDHDKKVSKLEKEELKKITGGGGKTTPIPDEDSKQFGKFTLGSPDSPLDNMPPSMGGMSGQTSGNGP